MLPTGKGPAGGGGGLAKVMAQWAAMSTKMKILTVGSVVVLVLGGLTFVMVSAANKPVPLYPTALTSGDVAEIGRVLNEHNTSYSVDGTKILVSPSQRSQIVGMLIGYGLPHRPLSNGDANGGGGMSPKTESEKKAAANQELQFELIDQLRQYEVVADAYVNIVPADDDELPQDRKPAKATVFLKLKPGSKPTATQIEAIVNLVAYSVNGLAPENVKVTDTTGFVWTGKDGKIAAASSGVGSNGTFESDDLALKNAYEKRYYDKIALALDPVLGHDKYTVTVDADLDFTQTKIESTQIGDPGGNNSAVEVQKTEKETYNNNPGGKSSPAAGPAKSAQQVSADHSMLQGKNGDDTKYEKVKVEVKTDVGKVEKTAVIPAGALKKVTATVAVDGKYDEQQMAGFKTLVASAIGLDESRGDTASVVPLAFNRTIGGMGDLPGVDALPADAWNRRRPSANSGAMMMVGMLIPTTILLTVLGVFLMRQRKVTMDKSGLILATSNGSTTSDISDLLSDKIGRSTAQNQTTRANNTEQLEKLAKEKPTIVAELLKSTWLSDKER